MATGKWINFEKRVSIPKGAKFDLNDNQWYIEQPTEHRPLFERLMAGEDIPVSVYQPSGCYVYIYLSKTGQPPAGESTSAGQMERLTWEEFEVLFPSTPNSDDDVIFTGPGLMIGLGMTPQRGAVLKSGERGLVLSSGIRGSGKSVELRVGLDPEELRSSLLLWDRLDWPEHSIIKSPLDKESQFLISEGIMQRTMFGETGNWFRKSQLETLHEKAFKLAQEAEPGRWAMASGSETGESAPGSAEGILIGLHNAIAIPARDVPLEEVLEFKMKRSAELFALREHLSDLYQQILLAPDRAEAWVTAREKLERAVADQVKSATETNWAKKVLKTLSATLAIDPISTGMAATAVGGALAVGAPITTVLGGGLGAISIKFISTMKASEKSIDPLKYVFSMHKNL